MADRAYKNVRRFAESISKEIKEGMANEVNDIVKISAVSDSVDLFGKHANELTKDLKFDGKKITATLPYVEDYTGFSGKPEEQEGNYLAFKTETCFKTIQVKTAKGTYDLDTDGIIVLIVNKTNPAISIIAKTAEDNETFTKKLEVELVLEPKPEASEE